jgi:hypothetical protein
MASLACIPPDLLGEIASFLPTYSIFHLWLSGDRQLRLIMTRGGVKSLTIHDHSMRSTSRWPMMLGDLTGLEKLLIKRPHFTIGPAALIWAEITRLSALRSLTLLIPDSLAIFKHGRVGKDVLDLGKIFPHLLTLEMGHLSQDPIYSWIRLPPGLQSVSGTCLMLETEPLRKSFPDPNTLTSLNIQRVQIGFDQAEPIHVAFPNLLTYVLVLPSVQLRWFSTLPKSLTTFELRVEKLTVDDESRDKSLGFFLPIGLRSLSLHLGMKSDLFNFDMRELVKLETLNLICSAFASAPNNAFALPESLKHLTLTLAFDALQVMFLPPNLESLDLTSCGKIKLSNIYTTKTTIDAVSVTNNSFNGLPKTLKSLKMPPQSANKAAFLNSIEGLELEQLYVSVHSFDVKDIDKLTLATLRSLEFWPSDTSVFNFHALVACHYLTYFKCRTESVVTPEDLQCLPMGLKTFYLTCPGLPAFNFGVLPSSLTSICIGFQPDGDSLLLTKASFANLVRFTDLDRLNIHMGTSSEIYNSDFALLPRGLRQLSIYRRLVNITSGCYAYLPRYLNQLQMPYIYNNLDPRDIACLPRGLSEFGYVVDSGSKLAPKFIASLPSPIHRESEPFAQDLDTETFPDPRTANISFQSHNETYQEREKRLRHVGEASIEQEASSSSQKSNRFLSGLVSTFGSLFGAKK